MERISKVDVKRFRRVMDSLGIFIKEAQDGLTVAIDASRDSSGAPRPLNVGGYPDDILIQETALRVTQLVSIREELFKAFPFLEELEKEEYFEEGYDIQHGADPEC